jgi:hypothetical protein
MRARQGTSRPYICDPLTYEILDSLETGIGVQDVLNDGDTLLVVEYESSTLRLYNLDTRMRTRSYQSKALANDSTKHEYIWRAAVDGSGRRVIAVAGSGIELGDLETGEMLANDVAPGAGWVAMSPNGRFAAASSTGLMQDLWRPRFWLFDVEGASLIAKLGTGDPSDSLSCGGWPTFLPDEKRVLIGPYPGLSWGPLQVFDIELGRIVRWIWVPSEDPDVRCFGVGRAPQ